MPTAQKTILFTCGREPSYIRNASLRQALEHHFQVEAATSSNRLLPLRYLQVAVRLLRRSKVDASLVGFYGQPLMLLVPWLIRRPVLFDAFLSTYEVLCFERKKFGPHSPVGRLALWIDRASTARANRIILGTQADIEHFSTLLDVPLSKMRRLLIGCNEKVYFPRPEITPVAGRVLFWGSFLPNQGVDVIVGAAIHLRQHSNIRFRLIGDGMMLPQARRMVTEQNLQNVEFLPSKPQMEMAAEAAAAAVCLTGEFGDFEKSRRVIAGKTYQVMALSKAPVVGDGPGNRELLTPGEDAVFVSMGDSQALAEAILKLVDDPALAVRMGQNARHTFELRAGQSVLGAELEQIILEMIDSPG